MENVVMRFLLLGVLWVFAFWMGTGIALADEIVLENGSVLTGTVEKFEKETLILKIDFSSKPIEIQLGRIKKIPLPISRSGCISQPAKY